MEERILANIKSLGIDMINKAGSGHPGIVLGAAPIIYDVYFNHLKFNPQDPLWINRDRFVLSAGHGSALLYAILFYSGFNLSLDDLKNFRQINSKTPGHPEYNKTPGVDISTGVLGQGFASAVGMAIAEKYLKNKYTFPKEMHNEKDQYLIDYKIYVLVSDGDLMEGISYEAASLAGNLNLDNLIVLYDSNNISLDGDLSNTFIENVPERFKALGWYTDIVKDGKNIKEIDEAINKAKTATQPAFIEIKTTIGYQSNLEGTNKVHGKPLDENDIIQLKEKLNIPNKPFYIDNEAINYFQKHIIEKNMPKYNEWINNYKYYVSNYLNNDDTSLKYLFYDGMKIDILNYPWEFKENTSLRNINNIVLSEIGNRIPNIIGGSADLKTSTKAFISKATLFEDGKYNGKNIMFGVREGAMGAILNGLALSKFIPFGSTFLTFADHLKPSIRMAALMNLPVIYIFTHDSIKVGMDGPTHQPIEQLAMLRAMPNLNVYRPADENEVIGCWNEILNTYNKPSALIISKDVLPLIPGKKEQVKYGAYIIRNEIKELNGIIIATGSEVSTAYNIANELQTEHQLDIRVVSMPSMELFKQQSNEYQQKLLPKGIKTIIIEAGSSFGWHQFTYDEKYLITINHFGFSGNPEDVLFRLNFNYDQIKKQVYELLK